MSSFQQSYIKAYDYIVRRIPFKGQQAPPRVNVYNSILSPFETYFSWLQRLLIWEQPYLSAAAFVTLNIVYWLIVSWNRGFISILSIFGIVLFLYKTWVNHIWPIFKVPPKEGEVTESWTSLHPYVYTIPEISQYTHDAMERLDILWNDVWKLRKENRGLFCALMCGFFSFLAFVGKIFPGVLIVYVLVLFMTLGPGICLHLIPATIYDQLNGFFVESDSQVSPSASKSAASDRDSDLEEFVPEMSPDIIRQLSLKEDTPEIPSPGRVLTESSNPVESLPEFGDDSYINESDDFSLYQGLGSFPSVEEENESDLDEENSDNILPSVQPVKTEMHFDPTHFKEDSSGSESDPFTEGLSFSKKTITDPSKEDSKTSAKAAVPQGLSLSDEDELADFEILEEADIPT